MKLSGAGNTSIAFTKAKDDLFEGMKSIENFRRSMVSKNSLITGEILLGTLKTKARALFTEINWLVCRMVISAALFLVHCRFYHAYENYMTCAFPVSDLFSIVLFFCSLLWKLHDMVLLASLKTNNTRYPSFFLYWFHVSFFLIKFTTKNKFMGFCSTEDGIIELEPIDPYSRLLLHRLADIFGYVSVFFYYY